ncbi:hypothetical protein [Streptomyces violaceorubidus]|uniref:hypothetical protein n=1 Tax=Streptomyces violaceorubidus TaxID=284042 RepID=UPI0004BEF845|nr:hypothetical protein [Streptomyces violaceorubidus]
MPSHKDYSERREAYCAWLTANHIDPGDVLLDADVYLDTASDGTRVIVYEACAKDAQGRKHVNERGDGVAIECRTTPLLVEPPDWWEPYRKPPRDQLLAVLDRVKALADEEGEANTYIERARLRAVLNLAYETEGLKP